VLVPCEGVKLSVSRVSEDRNTLWVWAVDMEGWGDFLEIEEMCYNGECKTKIAAQEACEYKLRAFARHMRRIIDCFEVLVP
jgi:hypothetical protein